MNIGFDLDQTLIDLKSVQQKIWKRHNLKYNQPIDWNFSNVPENIRNEIFKMFEDPIQMCLAQPYKYSKRLLVKLQEQGHKVFIITARNKKIKKATIEMTRKYFGNIKTYVSNFGESKLDILRKENIDIWIDDAPHEIINVSKNNIRCIMISNDNTIYNHYLRPQFQWVDSVKDLYKDINLFKE
jgi:hypothetical protein